MSESYWTCAGIKEITCNFGLDPDVPFVANVDDLLIEEESLNNPGIYEYYSTKPATCLPVALHSECRTQSSCHEATEHAWQS